MSVNSRLRKAIVFRLEETQTASGAKKTSWVRLDENILIAIYQANQFVSKERYRHIKTTHNAITSTKYLEPNKYRIVQGDKTFTILDVDNEHRLAQLSLEEIKLW